MGRRGSKVGVKRGRSEACVDSEAVVRASGGGKGVAGGAEEGEELASGMVLDGGDVAGAMATVTPGLARRSLRGVVVVGEGPVRGQRVVRRRDAAEDGAGNRVVGGVKSMGRAGSKPWKRVRREKLSAATKRGEPKGEVAFRVKSAEKRARESVKAAVEALREERREEKRMERERREAVKARREENQTKSTVVQTIADPTKIKKMSKKQLRQIKKTRVNARGVVEFVSPWTKE